MLGFKSFQNAKKVLAGVELIHKLKKSNTEFLFALACSLAISGAMSLPPITS